MDSGPRCRGPTPPTARAMDPELSGRFEGLRLPGLELWTPGPHALTPAVQEVLGTYRASCSHRSAEFKACYRKAADLLRALFRLPDDLVPLIFGHTGSYGWEMVAVNTPPRGRALGMDIGAFSKKWTEVFQRRGRSIDVLSAEWGEGIGLEAWTDAMARGYDLALITHNETSTGVALPVDRLSVAARETAPDTLIAVDGVSIAGAVDVDLGALRPDYYFWSLQKDFAIPAIGSVMIVSHRAVEVAGLVPDRGYVLDLVEWVKRAEDGQTPMTVPDLTLRCLIARLEEMQAEGVARYDRHRALSRMQRDWAQKRGLRVLAGAGFESPTVTAILLPEHIPGPSFVATARKLLNVQLAAGYGPTRDRAFRIAAMGHTSPEAMARVLEGLSLILDHWPEIS